MFIQKNKQENYQDKRVFSILGETKDNCMNRLCFIDFDNSQNFNDRINRLYSIEKTRQVLTGKQTVTGVVVVSEHFVDKGSVPKKQLTEFLRKIVLKHVDKVYPSSHIDFEVYTKSVQESSIWNNDIQPPEADYASLLTSIISAKEKNILDTVHRDSDILNQQGFSDFAKDHINLTFSNDADIVVTDKFFDLKYVQMLSNTRCRVLICFNEVPYLPNSIPVKHLEKSNIHIVPSSVTKLGNFLVAEGLYNNNKNIEESFYLTQGLSTNLNNSLWDFALDSKENFHNVVEEIYNGIKDETKNRFKLITQGVGAMNYRAKI